MTAKEMTLLKDVDKWEKDIRKSLNTGEGYFADLIIANAFEHLRVIELIRKNNYQKACDEIWDLDTSTRDAVPGDIFDDLDEVMEQHERA